MGKKKHPKTFKGNFNKMMTGDGRKNPETAFQEEMGLKKKKTKKSKKKKGGGLFF